MKLISAFSITLLLLFSIAFVEARGERFENKPLGKALLKGKRGDFIKALENTHPVMMSEVFSWETTEGRSFFQLMIDKSTPADFALQIGIIIQKLMAAGHPLDFISQHFKEWREDPPYISALLEDKEYRLAKKILSELDKSSGNNHPYIQAHLAEKYLEKLVFFTSIASVALTNLYAMDPSPVILYIGELIFSGFLWAGALKLFLKDRRESCRTTFGQNLETIMKDSKVYGNN